MNVSEQLGLENAEILTEGQMRNMSSADLFQKVSKVSVFAEIEPNQKSR